MTQHSDHVRVLDRRGNEFGFKIASPAATEYMNYIKVAIEYLDWVYQTDAERQMKEQAKRDEAYAVDSEIKRIQSTLNIITTQPLI
jgi:hypothetical protein